DYKNFLRLHIDTDGTLTVYPVGIDRVGRKWELRPDAAADAPWFAPVSDDARPHLIEAPIRMARGDA
ncbi:MAG: metallophosphoesterase, partial [Actinomycetota bacterium]|nr:metallophosphoesterase [Actinomycetota bacterium]